MNGYRMDGVGALGTTAGEGGLEQSLRAWLLSGEPEAMSAGARKRMYADLRGSHGRSRADRSSARILGGLVAVGAAIVAVLLVALGSGAGSSVGAWGGPPFGTGTQPLPDPTPGEWAYNGVLPWVALSLGAGILAGLISLRTSFFGLGQEPGALEQQLLPMPRRLGAVPRLAWLLGAAAIGLAIWYVGQLPGYLNSLAAQNGQSLDPFVQAQIVFSVLVGAPIPFVMAVTVPIRYRLGGRAARLLLASMIVPLVQVSIVAAAVIFRLEVWGFPFSLLALLQANVLTAAVGVALLVGQVRRAHPLLVGGGVALAFALELEFVLALPLEQHGALLLTELAKSLSLAGWLLLVWIARANRRCFRPAAARLLMLAGICGVFATVPTLAINGSAVFAPGVADEWLSALSVINPFWRDGLGALASVSLAAALLSGLRGTGAGNAVKADDRHDDRAGVRPGVRPGEAGVDPTPSAAGN